MRNLTLKAARKKDPGMRFRILGPLEIEADGARIEIASFKQRSVLALLLVHANQIVSTDRLIDELWGNEGSKDKQNALWVHVSNLRKVLEPGREKGTEAKVLITKAPGYLLRVDEDQVDAGRFAQLVAEGRALRATDTAEASLVLAEALSMWRGHALEDFTYESWAQPGHRPPR